MAMSAPVLPGLMCATLLWASLAAAQLSCSADGCPSEVGDDEGSLLQVVRRTASEWWCHEESDVGCPANDDCSTPAELEDDPELKAVKVGLNAGKEATKLAVKGLFTIGKEVFKLHPAGVFVGAIIEGAISAFWPSAPGGPCTTVNKLDHGLCLWNHVSDYVYDYVDQRLDQHMYREYAAKIAGIMMQLEDAKTWALNEVKTKDEWEWQEEHLAGKLHAIADSMGAEIPRFTLPGAAPGTAIFYAQWASLHMAVRAATYGTSFYRKEPYLNNTLRYLDNYLETLPALVEQAKSDRLAKIKRQYDSDHNYKFVTAKDTHGGCTWSTNRVAYQQLPRYVAGWQGVGDMRDSEDCSAAKNGVERCMSEHKSFISEEQDKFWQSAVLDGIADLDAFRKPLEQLPKLTAEQIASITDAAIEEKNRLFGKFADPKTATIMERIAKSGLIR